MYLNYIISRLSKKKTTLSPPLVINTCQPALRRGNKKVQIKNRFHNHVHLLLNTPLVTQEMHYGLSIPI